MSDSSNTFGTNDDSRSEQDRQLDILLQTASWPDVSAEAVSRLQSSWSNLSDAQVADATSVSPAEKAHYSTAARSRVGTVAAVIAAAVIAATAFWVGRTTAPNPVERVVDLEDFADSQTPDHDVRVPVPNPDPQSPDPTPARQDMVDQGSGGPNSTVPDGDSPDALPFVDPDTPLQPEVDPIRRTPGGAALALKQRDQEQLDAVLACLIDKPDADATCCQPLMRRRAAFEYLLWEVVQNATGQRQMAAVTAIGFVGTTQSIPKLVQTAENEELRQVAVQAVKRRANEQLLATVVSQNDDPEVAREFAIELVQRNSTAAAKVFLELIRDPRTRNRCLEVVDQASGPMIDAWYSAFDSSLISDRVAAAMALGRRTDSRTQERLRQLVAAYPARWEPVAALMAGGSEEAVQTLTALQQQPGRYAVIQTAAVQLKSLPGPDAAAEKNR